MSGDTTKTGALRARAGTNVAVSMVAAAAILVMVNYLGMRHYVRADWTASGLYTLSDKSLKVLAALDKPVEMYVLWSQGDRRFPDVKEILDRYLAASPRIRMEILDPDTAPDRVKMIIDRYGAKLRDMGGGMLAVEASVIVASGDNVKFVSASEFEDFGDPMLDQGGESEEVSSYKAEQALTSAVLAVTSSEQTRVCFTQGHGEWAFEGFGDHALGGIGEGLTQDGYKVEAIATAGGQARVPRSCGLVAVVGPQKAFSAEETSALEAYLSAGGRLLLLLDPVVDGDRLAATGLESLTADHGIALGSDVVLEVDARRLVSPSPLTFLASEFTSHAAVKPLSIPESVGKDVREQLGAYPVVFSTARSLSRREGSQAVDDVLARTSAASWGETDIRSLGAADNPPAKDGADPAGPLAVAMAATVAAKDPGGKEGRLVVVGDSDFLDENLMRNDGLYNRDFWSGLVAWLAARGELISIAAKNPEHVRLNLTESDVSTLWQVLVGEAVLVVVAGVLVRLRRRR